MAERETAAGGYEEPDRGNAQKAKDKAKEVKDQAKEKLSNAAHHGEDLMDEGKEKAREMGHRASDMARSRADEQRERVVGGMRTVADAIRRSKSELPEDRQQYGRLLEGVADRVDGASRYLEEHDVDSLTRDVRRVARDHAPAFLSGAFTLGLIGARVLKSSSDTAASGSAKQLGRGPGGYQASGSYSAGGGYGRGELYGNAQRTSGADGEFGTDTGIARGTVGPDYNELNRGIDRGADDVGADWDEAPEERGNV